jgi:hypothetical protein
VRIISQTTLPRPRRALRSNDCQRASSKLSIQKFLKRGLGRKEAAAYATLARFSTRITPRPWRTLRSHDYQRASHKLSVHAVTLCSPCAHTTTKHSPAHRRMRQALRRKRCTARPLLTRPALPRRTLRSHDNQRAPFKLSVHAVVSCSPYAYYATHYIVQNSWRSHDPQALVKLHNVGLSRSTNFFWWTPSMIFVFSTCKNNLSSQFFALP